MKLLAFETATEACSVALWLDGEVIERFEVAPRRHAELALPWADALLADAGIARTALDAIAVGRGPGAFTGVRLAIAIAQGIALGLDRPVVAISTLAALALPAARQSPRAGVLAAIDARMGELYVGAFRLRSDADSGGGFSLDALGPEHLSCGTDVQPDAGDWRGVGTGFAAQQGALSARLAVRFIGIDAAALPRACDVARLAVPAFALGEAVAPERLEPAYLRNAVALTLVEQQALRAR